MSFLKNNYIQLLKNYNKKLNKHCHLKSKFNNRFMKKLSDHNFMNVKSTTIWKFYKVNVIQNHNIAFLYKKQILNYLIIKSHLKNRNRDILIF